MQIQTGAIKNAVSPPVAQELLKWPPPSLSPLLRWCVGVMSAAPVAPVALVALVALVAPGLTLALVARIEMGYL